jgi:SOS response regulatory protein OraA/RecX
VAAGILRRAPRTAHELEARLVELGYRPETAAATVERCVELGWVNDVVLAVDRARALRLRGHGSLRIVAELEARGVAEAAIAAAVEESRAGESEAAWARRALRGERNPARAWRLLASRGFAEEVALDVLG